MPAAPGILSLLILMSEMVGKDRYLVSKSKLMVCVQFLSCFLAYPSVATFLTGDGKVS